MKLKDLIKILVKQGLSHNLNKLKSGVLLLMRDIQFRSLCKIVAFMCLVEFQKRGLPHAHILLIFNEIHRQKLHVDLDSFVSAEIPSVDFLTATGQEQQEKLLQLVQAHMIHGPCGTFNMKSPCMTNNECSKHFPKKFADQSFFPESNSHPVYRRRSTEQGGATIEINNALIDNRWIVPYNPFLLLKFQCHINVEVCSSALAAKYLSMYITKVRFSNYAKIQ